MTKTWNHIENTKKKMVSRAAPCLRCRDSRRGIDRGLVRVARAKQSHLRLRQLLCSQSRTRCANHLYHLAMRPHESHARGECEPPSHIHQPSWMLVAAYSAIIKHTRTPLKSFATAWATEASKHEYGDTCKIKIQTPNSEHIQRQLNSKPAV